MSKDDIEKAQKEAEAHADEDKKKREAVDARNSLENGIYQAEKMPKEYADKISDDDKKVIEEAVKEAKKHLESDDKDELEKATNELLEKIQAIGAKLYEAAAKEEAPAEGGDAKSSDKDGPVEGEVVEGDKKDKKKGKKK